MYDKTLLFSSLSIPNKNTQKVTQKVNTTNISHKLQKKIGNNLPNNKHTQTVDTPKGNNKSSVFSYYL